MIVVPAFAARHQCHPPVVARIVACKEALANPTLRGGIHQPRSVQTNSDAEEDTPENEFPSAKNQQSQSNRARGEPNDICSARA